MSDPFPPTPNPVPPTPEEAYNALPYHFPRDESTPVVRFRVHGPAPFNTVAVLHTFFVPGLLLGASGHLERFKLTAIPTQLQVKGFDHDADPSLHQVQSSSLVALRTLQLDDDASFLAAIDAVMPHQPVPGSAVRSSFDEQGRWLLDIDVAGLVDHEDAQFGLEVTSWVLFHEPAAAAGAPPASPEPGGGSILPGQAHLHVAEYRRYLALPQANVLKAAGELTRLSGQLAGASLFLDSVAPQQLAVDALAHFSPAAADALEAVIALAEARHNLIVRLRDADQSPPAAALAKLTVTGYRDYADREGADLFRVQRDLAELVKPLLAVGAIMEALAAQKAALEVLERIQPEAGKELDHEIQVVEAQHNLVARLLDTHDILPAEELAKETIQAYRDYAAKPGADVARAVTDLRELADVVLAPAGRIALATQATQAANDLAPD